MWQFEKLAEGQPERDPHEAEFFKVGDLNLASTLVREFIQNSLDAKLNINGIIKVRFKFGKIESKKIDIYLSGLLEHVKSAGILETDANIKNQFSYLIIEDFGTSGLDGTTNRPENGRSSNFYNFWQREGKSQKTGTNAGRWGLGKTVYHIASKLRAFWGYSIRADDKKKLLQGKALLLTHPYNKEMYNYYGYFRNKDNCPIDSMDFIKTFCDFFSVSRKEESGLSIIIPLPHEEITSEEIIQSVIIHYFFPIIKGNLIVEIFNERNSIDKSVIIDERTILDYAFSSSFNWYKTPWQDKDVKSIMNFVEDAATLPESDFYHLNHPENKSTNIITEDFFQDKLDEIRDKFNESKLLCFRIPISIEPKGQNIMKSFYDIYIQRDNNLKRADEFYIRAGITISELKRLSHHRSVRALLNAHDHPISMFLGDSEAPAHTDWNERTKDFREKYINAVSTLKFIKNSMRDIVKILDQPPEDQDINFLKDIFFIKSGDDKDSSKKTKKPDLKLPQPKPELIKIFRLENGFKLSLLDKSAKLPIETTVQIAYDVLRGNPFASYNKLDFNLLSNSIKIEKKGCSVLNIDGNTIIISIIQSDFELKIYSFDKKRDLIIRINSRIA